MDCNAIFYRINLTQLSIPYKVMLGNHLLYRFSALGWYVEELKASSKFLAPTSEETKDNLNSNLRASLLPNHRCRTFVHKAKDLFCRLRICAICVALTSAKAITQSVGSNAIGSQSLLSGGKRSY